MKISKLKLIYACILGVLQMSIISTLPIRIYKCISVILIDLWNKHNTYIFDPIVPTIILTILLMGISIVFEIILYHKNNHKEAFVFSITQLCFWMISFVLLFENMMIGNGWEEFLNLILIVINFVFLLVVSIFKIMHTKHSK